VVVRHSLFWVVLLLCFPVFAAQTVVSFDEYVSPGGHYVGSLAIDAATFVGTYNPEWNSWAGFAFSAVSNTTDGSWFSQYAAAQARTNAYAVGYHDSWNPAPEIRFVNPVAPRSVRVDNTTYAALTMRYGYPPARAFTNGDYFILTLTARNLDGQVVAATNHYLADFRDGRTFIQTNWSTLDLSWMPADVVSIVATVTTSDVGDWGPNTPTYFALADFTYAYSGFDQGISATNPAIRCWADGVAGYNTNPTVSNQFRNVTNALGPAEVSDGFNGSTNVVSLGENGAIVLTFPAPITDGPGPDFAVFENAFSENFLELAFVGVSSDGTNFVFFPCHTLSTNLVDSYASTGVTESDAYGGLAGKHRQGTGTPFDLRVLAGKAGLNVHRITHVMLQDIRGSGQRYDDYLHPIYDPFPTVGSGGFDLDAVGVLNPLIEITADPAAPPPALPGYQTLLEYKATLDAPAWTTNAPAHGSSGFFRYRLVK
jgi:hypothetical protein